MKITIQQDVVDKFKCAILFFTEIQNSQSNQYLWQEIDSFSQQLRKSYNTPSQASELFKASRKLYRSIGIDPTRRRPSSEALLRRIIQGTSLYKVNTLVDAGNFCSIHFQLSIGFYDAQQIKGIITFRLGGVNEHYQGINKGMINVTGRLALVDVGPQMNGGGLVAVLHDHVIDRRLTVSLPVVPLALPLHETGHRDSGSIQEGLGQVNQRLH